MNENKTKYIDILHKQTKQNTLISHMNVNKTKYIDILHKRKQNTSLSHMNVNKTKYIDIPFCLYLCRISMYFVLFTFMWDIDVFCFVYIHVG